MKKIAALCAALVLTSVGTLFAQAEKTMTLDKAIHNAYILISGHTGVRRTAVVIPQSPTVELSNYLADELTSQFQINPSRTVISRTTVADAETNAKVMPAKVTQPTVRKIGGAVGAAVAVGGNIRKSGKIYRMELYAIDVNGGSILKEVRYKIRPDQNFIDLLAGTPATAASTASDDATDDSAASDSDDSSTDSAASDTDSGDVSAAPAPVDASTKITASFLTHFLADKPDILTAAAQTASFKAFQAAVERTLVNISVDGLKSVPNGDKVDFKFAWHASSNIDAVKGMARFYQLLASASQTPSYLDALKASSLSDTVEWDIFKYFPESYSNTPQGIKYAVFPDLRSPMTNDRFYIKLEIALCDKNGTPIQTWTRNVTFYAPYGKNTGGGLIQDTLGKDAWNHHGDFKITRISIQ
jgi:TolB-like protein